VPGCATGAQAGSGAESKATPHGSKSSTYLKRIPISLAGSLGSPQSSTRSRSGFRASVASAWPMNVSCLLSLQYPGRSANAHRSATDSPSLPRVPPFAACLPQRLQTRAPMPSRLLPVPVFLCWTLQLDSKPVACIRRNIAQQSSFRPRFTTYASYFPVVFIVGKTRAPRRGAHVSTGPASRETSANFPFPSPRNNVAPVESNEPARREK